MRRGTDGHTITGLFAKATNGIEVLQAQSDGIHKRVTSRTLGIGAVAGKNLCLGHATG